MERVEWQEMSTNLGSIIEGRLAHLGAEVIALCEPYHDRSGVVLWATRESMVAQSSEDGIEYGVHWVNMATGDCESGLYTTVIEEAVDEFSRRVGMAAGLSAAGYLGRA